METKKRLIWKRPPLSQQPELNEQILKRLRLKKYYFRTIKIENDPSLIKTLSHGSFKKALQSTNALNLITDTNLKKHHIKKFAKFLRSANKIRLQFEANPKKYRFFLNTILPKSLLSLKVLFKEEFFLLEIPKVYHILRKHPKCTFFDYSFSVPDLNIEPFIAEVNPKQRTYHVPIQRFQNQILSPTIIRHHRKLQIRPETLHLLPNLKSLSLIGSISRENMMFIISYLKQIGKLNIELFKLRIFSGVDICQLTSSLAAFLSTQLKLKNLVMHLDYESTLYNQLLIQSIFTLKSLESIDITLKKWDPVFLFGTISENLRYLTKLRRLNLVIENAHFEAEAQTWKHLGKSLEELKNLESLRIKLPKAFENRFDIVFKEVKSFPKLTFLSLDIVSKKNASQMKTFFEKLGHCSALRKLRLSINVAQDEGIHAKLYGFLKDTLRSFSKVEEFHLRLGKMNPKTSVLPDLLSGLLFLKRLYITIEKHVCLGEWKNLVQVLQKQECKITTLSITLEIDEGSFKLVDEDEIEYDFHEVKKKKLWERLEVRLKGYPKKGKALCIAFYNDGFLLQSE